MKTYALAAITALTLTVSCGRDPEVPEIETVKTAGNGGLGIADAPCTKTVCEPLTLYIEGPSGSGAAIANLQQDNVWTFTAKAQGSTSRNVKLHLYNGPSACQQKWTGQDTNSVSCTYRPTDVNEKGRIKAVARDVDYCNFKYNSPDCADLNKSLPGGAKDFEQEFEYNVADNAPVTIDPAFFQNPGPQFGANGGVRGCASGMLLPGLIGVFTGNFLPAVMGCARGYVNGLTQSQSYPSSGAQTLPGSGIGGIGTGVGGTTSGIGGTTSGIGGTSGFGTNQNSSGTPTGF